MQASALEPAVFDEGSCSRRHRSVDRIIRGFGRNGEGLWSRLVFAAVRLLIVRISTAVVKQSVPRYASGAYVQRPAATG
jgi:hypothetical protein